MSDGNIVSEQHVLEHFRREALGLTLNKLVDVLCLPDLRDRKTAKARVAAALDKINALGDEDSAAVGMAAAQFLARLWSQDAYADLAEDDQ